MKFILAIVNLGPLAEWHSDDVFDSMEALLEFVKRQNFEWSSLVVNVLPPKEA